MSRNSSVILAFLTVIMHIQQLASGQTAAGISLQMHPGLTITGEVNGIYSIESTDTLHNSNAWRCLEFVQLTTAPYFWVDKTPATPGKRFYRAILYAPPTNMVFIPPGNFLMGYENPIYDDEAPLTDVTITRGFWMGKFEITQEDYVSLMHTNPSVFGSNGGFPEDLRRPVETVSWFDATNYCAMLTKKEFLLGRLPRNCLYRLPTEAEWEYACRARSSTRFSYGDDAFAVNLGKHAWFTDNGGSMTHPVGQKLPNPWGLYDMHGNVSEWCWDAYGLYPGGFATDLVRLPFGDGYPVDGVLRSGSWDDVAGFCASGSRLVTNYSLAVYTIGFRVVLSPRPAWDMAPQEEYY